MAEIHLESRTAWLNDISIVSTLDGELKATTKGDDILRCTDGKTIITYRDKTYNIGFSGEWEMYSEDGSDHWCDCYPESEGFTIDAVGSETEWQDLMRAAGSENTLIDKIFDSQEGVMQDAQTEVLQLLIDAEHKRKVADAADKLTNPVELNYQGPAVLLEGSALEVSTQLLGEVQNCLNPDTDNLLRCLDCVTTLKAGDKQYLFNRYVDWTLRPGDGEQPVKADILKAQDTLSLDCLHPEPNEAEWEAFLAQAHCTEAALFDAMDKSAAAAAQAVLPGLRPAVLQCARDAWGDYDGVVFTTQFDRQTGGEETVCSRQKLAEVVELTGQDFYRPFLQVFGQASFFKEPLNSMSAEAIVDVLEQQGLDDGAVESLVNTAQEWALDKPMGGMTQDGISVLVRLTEAQCYEKLADCAPESRLHAVAAQAGKICFNQNMNALFKDEEVCRYLDDSLETVESRMNWSRNGQLDACCDVAMTAATPGKVSHLLEFAIDCKAPLGVIAATARQHRESDTCHATFDLFRTCCCNLSVLALNQTVDEFLHVKNAFVVKDAYRLASEGCPLAFAEGKEPAFLKAVAADVQAYSRLPNLSLVAPLVATSRLFRQAKEAEQTLAEEQSAARHR